MSRIQVHSIPYRFTEQQKHSVSLGNTSEEVYNNLRMLGLVYDISLDAIDYSLLNRMHEVLTKVYGGDYPLRRIMDNVNAVE